MKCTPKHCRTKTGKQLLIRMVHVEDAQAILDLKRGYLANTTTLPLLLEEYPDDLAKETQLIKDYAASDNSIFLVAEHEGQLIGNIDLTGSKRSKLYHTAMLGMGIHEQWRNQGVGKLLIQHSLDWARGESGIELVWLDVYATNALGFQLYKNAGFTVSGSIPGFFKEEDEAIDKIQMFQRIK